MAGEKHTWRIECELYHNESGEAVIPDKKGENITIDKTLRPAYGFLNVTSSPESGAIVYIDGKNFGTTPRVLTNVLIGTHELKLEKTGCAPVVKSITLDDKNKLTINEKLAKIEVAHTTSATSMVSETAVSSSSSGVFSVSATRQVIFAQGNLQYQASTNTWRFAEHQWDIIGDANKNISSSYSGWIDLFGWGTSGYNGNSPNMTSTTSTDYGSGERDIAGTNYDWGVYNTISNGSGKQWRTLTNNEWVYVFDKRSTSSGIRYAKATVNGVNGVILLPDNWSSSNYSLSNTNKSVASFSSNRISQSDWTSKLESNGAVCLPAAGWRDGMSVGGVGSIGRYWSASYDNCDDSRSVGFGVGRLNADKMDGRRNGQSVRLVSLAE